MTSTTYTVLEPLSGLTRWRTLPGMYSTGRSGAEAGPWTRSFIVAYTVEGRGRRGRRMSKRRRKRKVIEGGERGK